MRTRANLTIQALADAANVSASTIWRAEHGLAINAESRRRLCGYFQLSAQKLGLLVDSVAHVPDNADVAASQSLSQPGLLLALGAQQLDVLYDGGWSDDALLTSLRILLRCIHGVPSSILEFDQHRGGKSPALAL